MRGMDLSGRVAVVSGASRGIGRAVAEHLAHYGAKVVVNYATRPDGAADAVALIERHGKEAIAVQGDVSRPADVARLFDAAEERFGRIDAVVSNAGVGAFVPLAAAGEDDFDRVFALNARGTFLMRREAARRVTDGGRIVSVSTAGTLHSAPGAGIYTASKAAVEQLSLALAGELGARGVTVNVVSPGSTDTDGLIAPEDLRARWVANTPLGRLGRPDDIAEVVAFLVSDAARWVTGQNLRVSGGLVA